MIIPDQQKPRIGTLVRILISLKMVKATAAAAVVVVVVEEEAVGELAKAAMEVREALEEMKTAGTMAGTRAEALIEVTFGQKAFDESL